MPRSVIGSRSFTVTALLGSPTRIIGEGAQVSFLYDPAQPVALLT